MLNPRHCRNCGDLVAGRANKVFCSETCKGQHFRTNAEPQARAAARPVAVAVALPVGPPEEEEEITQESIAGLVDEVYAKYRADEVQKVQAARDDLHGQYAAVVRQFLKMDGRPVDLGGLSRFLNTVEDVNKAYAIHPEAGSPDTPPAARLELLEDMLAELRDLLDEAQHPPRSFWSLAKPRSVVWDEEFRDELVDSLAPPH